MATNSRQKGKLEWAKFLNEKVPEAKASGGQQASERGMDGTDVMSALPFHWEVKRVQQLNLHDAVDKCRAESGYGRWPAVAHRKNDRKWVVSMDAEDFLKLAKLLWTRIF
jgi:hypothetical protein